MTDVGVKPERPHVYLGDGLYTYFDGYHYVLYASNGLSTTDKVYLDPVVLKKFIEYTNTKGYEI